VNRFERIVAKGILAWANRIAARDGVAVPPFVLLTPEEARQWVRDNQPVCPDCGQVIDADRDNYTVSNSSTGIRATHIKQIAAR